MSPVVGAAPAPALRDESRHMRLLRGGDPHALEELYREYRPRLLSFCRHMLGNPEEAEDAVQLTFLAAHVQLPHERPDTSVGAWLFTVARRKCIDILRRRRAHEPLDEQEASLAGLAAEVEQREDLRKLVGDVQRLDDVHRAALVMTQLEALSQAQVAQVLGTSEPRVRRLVFEARQSLLERRESRDLACRAVQEELANARGSQFRRRHLVVHCEECEDCEQYRTALLAQRTGLRVVLPVLPMLLGAKKAWASSSVPRPRSGRPRRFLDGLARVPAPGLAALTTVMALSVMGGQQRLGDAIVGRQVEPGGGAVFVAPSSTPPRARADERVRRQQPVRRAGRKPARVVLRRAAAVPAPFVPGATQSTAGPGAAMPPRVPDLAPTPTPTTTAPPTPTIAVGPVEVPVTTVPTVTTPPETVPTETTPVPTTTVPVVPDEDGCTGTNNGNGQGEGCNPNGPGTPGGRG